MSINQYLKPSSTHARQDDGTVGIVTVRNYQHASRIFVDSDYRLSPKYNFLFYVEFDFNVNITNISNTTAQELGMIVKSVSLPKFSIQVKEHNAYNRKNYVQNSIKYDPVTIKFHDDQADDVRNFWYDYYSYYYRDPDYADATYQALHKYQSRPSFDWGYTPRPAVGYNSSRNAQPYQYIQAIRIYSLYQKSFSEYELVNPIITSFKHGEHVNGESGLMEHEMSVQYETVKYYTGYTTADTVGGYIDLHYDNTPSPIAPDGGTNLTDTINGSLTTVPDTITDLATPSTTENTLSGAFQSVSNNPASTTASAMNRTTTGSASSPTNSGGTVIPIFGGTGGLNLGSSFAGAASNFAGAQTSSLANGVVGANSSGAAATIGALGAALSNPKATIQTIENMALAFGEGIAINYVNQNVVNPLVQGATNTVNSTVSQYVTQPLTSAWNSTTSAVSNFFNPAPALPVVPATNVIPAGDPVSTTYPESGGFINTYSNGVTVAYNSEGQQTAYFTSNPPVTAATSSVQEVPQIPQIPQSLQYGGSDTGNNNSSDGSSGTETA